MKGLVPLVILIVVALAIRVKLEKRLLRINREMTEYNLGLRDTPPRVTWFDEVYYNYNPYRR